MNCQAMLTGGKNSSCGVGVGVVFVSPEASDDVDGGVSCTTAGLGVLGGGGENGDSRGVEAATVDGGG